MQCLLITCRRHQVQCGLIFLITCTLCFLYIIRDERMINEDRYDHLPLTHILDANTSLYIPFSKSNLQSYRLVLLWTNLFDDIYWHHNAFFNSSIIVSCSAVHQCQFTRDRRRLSEASVVAFHLYDINRYRLPERISMKTNNQSWTFITGESPVNFYYINPSFYPSIFDNYFDDSISYKYTSPYAIFSPTIKPRLSSKLSLNLSLPYTDERQLNQNSLQYKKKPIAWIVSNCVTFSQRENYVAELRKFIQVDIFGKCGQACSKQENRQCQINLNEYYFYLAFENSRCNSYITEKFWNILSNNTHRLVPIVMGAPENDYERSAPKQSFIHVNKYKTPEELAKYLNYLIQNPEEYLRYLQWREYTEIEPVKSEKWKNLLCPLCQMAHKPRLSLSSTRLNFSHWYNPKTECHPDDAKRFRQCKQANLNGWMNWIHNTKCP